MDDTKDDTTTKPTINEASEEKPTTIEASEEKPTTVEASKEKPAINEASEEKQKQFEALEKNKPEETDIKSRNKPEEKKPTVWLQTKAIAATLTRQDLLAVSLRGFIIQSIYLFLATMYCLGFNSPSIFYTNEALRTHLLAPFPDAAGMVKTFDNINSVSDIWNYIEYVYLPTIFNTRINLRGYDAEAEKRCALYVDTLLGSARIRQVRVTEKSCKIWPPIKKYRSICYGFYSEENKDKSTFGLGDSTAWRYNTGKATGELSTNRGFNPYGGDGYYMDLTQDVNSSYSIVRNLKENMWLGEATRAVFLKASFYNANLNLFTLVEILFELLPMGSVEPSTRFSTVQLVKYVNAGEDFILICQYLYFVFVLVFTISIARDVIYFKHHILKTFWTYIDIAIFVCSLMTFLNFMEAESIVERTLDNLKKSGQSYGNIERAVRHNSFYVHLAAISAFLVYIRTFQYMNLSSSMGQLNSTIRKCAFDIGMYSIIFFIVFLAFCHFGYMLFGSRVYSFSTFNLCMFTLFRTVFGDFDYEAIARVDPVAGRLFFLVYIVSVFFVLLNLFLSIISDTYLDIKADLKLSYEEMQMIHYIKLKLRPLFRKCGLKWFEDKKEEKRNPRYEKIKDALRRCGFSPLEINMFFAKFNIDPLAEVGEYDLEEIKAEIERRQKLQESARFKKGMKHGDNLVMSLEDFNQEDEKLSKIETTLEKLHEKTDMLLDELDEKIKGAKRTFR